MRILLAGLLILAAANLCLAATAPKSPAELEADKLKSMYRREPEAQELVPKIQQALKAMKPGEIQTRRIEYLQTTIMQSSSISGDRLHDAVESLRLLGGPVHELTAQDLSQLQQRYEKLCANLDDQVFVKDLDAVLHLHDRFVRQTSMSVWDKDKISSELKRIEESYESAPPIPYGRSELLRSLQEKRLAPPSKGCYVGLWPREEIFLSSDRPSVGVLEESTGAKVVLDTATLEIQDKTGKTYGLDSCNRPDQGVPFSPPLSLWMKCRLLEGHVPAIQFKLANNSGESKDVWSVQDVLDGKTDEYFAKNLKIIGEPKAAVLAGLFENFDRSAAATAFGADGRTPYYSFVDPKLSKLPADKLAGEVEKRLAKGGLTKDVGAELRNHYGDPNIPDGPERVRDAWKHFHDLCLTSGSSSIGLYCCTGAYHGNKKGLSLNPTAGAEDWNKLEYYWPGEGIIDWVGTAATGCDLKSDPGAVTASMDQFMKEVNSSNWHSLPVMLRDIGPGPKRETVAEADWIAVCFQQTLPQQYPTIKAFFAAFPGELSLHESEAHGAFRREVGSNSYYKPALRLRQAVQQQAQSGN